jgi:C1A family cysteine protease
MNKFILILAIIGFASALKADSFHGLWSAWKSQHNKVYAASEELVRFGIFIENFQKINRLNAENDSARFALNKFADLTGTEFKALHATGAFYEPHRKFVAANSVSAPIRNLPDNVDWRNKGAVTPVKDQAQCGSCWAFSVTGLIEGFYFNNNGKLLSFSEQQIVDCDTEENEGCNGGWPYLAVEYAAKNGLEVESDYPYTARDGKCKYQKSKAINVANAYQFVTANSTDQLKNALVSGPVSVLVEADESAFQFYSSGVVRKNCGADLDHAVLAVGYQKLGLYEAFIVKNSWGTSWGSDGYIFIGTDSTQNKGQGVCGILAQPLIAVN